MFNLIKLSIAASICLYLVGAAFAWSGEQACKGWSCEEVDCPAGYAVQLPNGTYLPCDQWDAYMAGDKSVVVK